MKTYDAIVIGGGPGGYVCAIRLGQLKQKTLVHREGRAGRRVPQLGLHPLEGADRRGGVRREDETRGVMGIKVSGVEVDVNALQDWKDGIVKRLTGGVRQLLKGNGAELMAGTATITGPNTVSVLKPDGTTEIIEATKASCWRPAPPRSRSPRSSSTASR
jgi:dihydrolipoamide dehydrogenase